MDPGIRINRLLSSVLLCLLLAAPTAEAEASRKPLQLTRLAARKLASRQHTVNRLLDRVESRGAIRPASPHAAVFLVDGEPVDLETRDWGRTLDEAFRAVLRDARWKSEDSVVVDFSPAKASATLDDSGRGRSPHLPAVCDSPEEWLK